MEFTKSDCYSLSDFLQDLIEKKPEVFSQLGYPEVTKERVSKLINAINTVVAKEQGEQDYTEEDADILEIKHIPYKSLNTVDLSNMQL